MSMKNQLRLILLGLLAIATTAAAYDKSDTMSPDAMDTFQVSSGGVLLNNFIVKEENSILSEGMHNLKVSYAARNKNGNPKAVVVMVVGMAGSEILWSLNVNPALFMLAENDNETCEGEIYVTPGTLKKTTKIWIRVLGDF